MDDWDDAFDRDVLFGGPIRWGQRPADELSWLTIAVVEPVELENPWQHSADAWWASVGDQLITAAFQQSALDFNVITKAWGVVYEVAFATDQHADAYRHGEAMRSAIDQLGPLRLEVTSGRGGGTASVRAPRRGRPLIGSGAAALPIPVPEPQLG